jgi:hypothetical protein
MPRFVRIAARYIKKRGALQAGEDPQANSFETTFNSETLIKMAEGAVSSDDPNMLRNWCMHIWQCLTVGRGEDVRERHINELLAPKFVNVIGERLVGGAARPAAVPTLPCHPDTPLPSPRPHHAPRCPACCRPDPPLLP